MVQMVPHIRQDMLWLKLTLMPSWKQALMCKKSSWVDQELSRKMTSEGYICASVFTLKVALTKCELLANSDMKYLAYYLITLQKQKHFPQGQERKAKHQR